MRNSCLLATLLIVLATNTLSAELPKLTGAGDHLPIPDPNPGFPLEAVAATDIEDSAGGFTGTWGPTVQPDWVGTFAATGPIPRAPNSGNTVYDFTALPRGYLPPGTFFVPNDVDAGAGVLETFRFEAFDIDGNTITNPWLTVPFAVGGHGGPNDLPGWEWNGSQYFFTGNTVPGNPSVGVAFISCEPIYSMLIEKPNGPYNFNLFAPEATCTFSSNNTLCEIEDDQLTDNFVTVGDFTNLQDIPVNHLLLPPNETSPAGVEVCFGDDTSNFTFDTPLNNGDSFTLGGISNEDAIIIKNAQPGDTVCFVIVGFNEIEGECCRVDVCIEMPPCDCLQVDTRLSEFDGVICNDDGTVDFDYSFQLTNLFGQDVFHAFLIPNGDEALDADYFDLFIENGNAALQHGHSVSPLTTRVTGALPEMPVSFLILIHNEDFSECCSIEHEVPVPECSSEATAIKGDVNGDSVINLLDVAPFVDAASNGNYLVSADVNCDGVVNLLDVDPFASLLQQ